MKKKRKIGISKRELFRFFVRIKILPNGCWKWIGAGNRYGTFRKLGGQEIGAHRFSYEKFVKKIPKEKVIDHLCRNTKCVNPIHLEVVTQRENLLRGDTIAKLNANKTKCKNGHTLEDCYLKRREDGIKWRACRTCQKIRSRAFYVLTNKKK